MKTSHGSICGLMRRCRAQLFLFKQPTRLAPGSSPSRASKITLPVSESICPRCIWYHCLLFIVSSADYPRTLREWGRRVEANLTPEMLADDFPGIMNPAEFEAFKRKWHYLVAYAGVGFAKGYTTCHMWTFIRQVCRQSSIVSCGLTNRGLMQNDAPDPKCY